MCAIPADGSSAGRHATALLTIASTAHPEGSPYPRLDLDLGRLEVGRSVPLSRDQDTEANMRIAGHANPRTTTPLTAG
jgi:hypothetical protein